MLPASESLADLWAPRQYPSSDRSFLTGVSAVAGLGYLPGRDQWLANIKMALGY